MLYRLRKDTYYADAVFSAGTECQTVTQRHQEALVPPIEYDRTGVLAMLHQGDIAVVRLGGRLRYINPKEDADEICAKCKRTQRLHNRLDSWEVCYGGFQRAGDVD